jgi:hypothetical protein
MGAAAGTQPGGLPFTVSQETTGIVAPLDGQGRPDYVRAIQAEQGEAEPGERVAPEKNGYALWLRLLGRKGVYPETLEATERMLGETLPAEGTWESFDNYLKRTGVAEAE